MALSSSIDQDGLNIENYIVANVTLLETKLQQQKMKLQGIYYPFVSWNIRLAICRILCKSGSKSRFIWFFQLEDFLQVSEKKNPAKVICYDVSHLNKPLIQIKNLTVFSGLPPEDVSKMQKRTGGVLHGGFVELIYAVRRDRGYFFPSSACMILCCGYKLEPL